MAIAPEPLGGERLSIRNFSPNQDLRNALRSLLHDPRVDGPRPGLVAPPGLNQATPERLQAAEEEISKLRREVEVLKELQRGNRA